PQRPPHRLLLTPVQHRPRLLYLRRPLRRKRSNPTATRLYGGRRKLLRLASGPSRALPALCGRVHEK
ncbi:MAG: hypothetical protein NTY65_01895, partial [Planctomycetota bacterium]|nr:hypothetical protein [Planctomycetota bacterium]